MNAKFFAPFVPTEQNLFDARKAAHLLRRTGFGAPPAAVAAAVENGLEATVDSLFDESTDEGDESEKIFGAVSGGLLNFGDISQCQAWWVFRMLRTQTPLREKLTLFWHGHFATSFQKIDNTQLMLQQLGTLRQHAWGSFSGLVLAVAKDPAMLVWLDGESSSKDHPNENFARELMELFTCGIGNYSEQDVLEAARAFTGWHRAAREFVFNADAHDNGSKTILGKRGKFDGGDVIDLLLSQPATARFLARKLLRFFAAPAPAEEVVAEGAELLERTQFKIKWFLRELFLSQYFYSEACYRQRISSPVEFAVGAVRTLGARQPAVELVNSLNSMGQELLLPPNVKGWDGEEQWINSSSLAARTAFANTIAGLDAGEGLYNPDCPIAEIVPAEYTSPTEIVDHLAEVLFQGELSAGTRRQMVAFLLSKPEDSQIEAPNAAETFREDEGYRAERIRSLLAVLLALPEFQAY